MDLADSARRQRAIDERVELYYAAHPRGAAAVRRPRVTRRRGMWVASLSADARQQIVGTGDTVEAALRDFDYEYLNYLRPVAA
jgi:hypothetical protein